jgi:actinorhodin biosynthesis protein ActVIA
MTISQIYAEVQGFYARQMQRLDAGKFEDYAATFTEDGEFSHTPGMEPARTRDGIVAELYDFHKKFENDPMQRRHWFNMIDLDPQPDGVIFATFYALIVKTRPGQVAAIAPSCVVHDVLVRTSEGLLNKSRRVEYD